MSVEIWRMGATPVPARDIGRLAREMEEHGWAGLAVGEAHGILPDPYPTLTLAAAATTTLKVGTAVAVPLREPVLAASAMATVHGFSGGRASFSIGRGDGAMKVLQRRPMRVAEFERYLRELQGLLRGDEVDLEGAATSIGRIGLIDPSLDRPKPPVNVAATGPRMIGVAARWADGISFAVGADAERLCEGVATARSACREAGRDPGELVLGCYLQLAVCDGDADRDRAREAIRGLVMTHSRFSAFEGRALAGVTDRDHQPIRRSLDAMESVLRSSRGGMTEVAGGAPGELDFYPRDAVDASFVDRFAIVGDPDYCARRLGEIAALGIERIYIGTRGVGADVAEENTRRIGRDVLPRLAATR